jgi:hypothetical protein
VRLERVNFARAPEGHAGRAANGVTASMSGWVWSLMLGVSAIWLVLGGALAYLVARAPAQRELAKAPQPQRV